jgi:hypothetical protein
MKWTWFLFAALIIGGCSERKSAGVGDRFVRSLQDATTIGTLSQLTDDQRAIYPVFGPGDTIACYQRLLLTESEDTFAYYDDEMVKPYGVHVSSRELYTLSRAIDFPSALRIDTSKLPDHYGKDAEFAVASPDTLAYAFETVSGENQVHTLYLVTDDSVTQLSFGPTSCFLDRFSNTGRYLTAVYGKGPTWLLVYDLIRGGVYRIPHDSSFVDYLTVFSQYDEMMLFIRSDKNYRWGSDFFGDIWLFKFGIDANASGD